MDSERIIKICQLAVGFLIVCGILDQFIYYSIFHLNIFEYLSFSEILTSFFGGVIGLLLTIAVPIIGGMFNEIEGTKDPFPFIKKSYEENTGLFFLIACSTMIVILVVLSGLLWSAAPANLVVKNWSAFAIYFSLIIITPVLGYALLIEWEKLKELDAKVDAIMYNQRIKYILGYSLLFMIFMTSVRSLKKGSTVLRNKANAITIVITSDNDTIRTNSDHYYIGRTNGYILFFDSCENKIDILSATNVKKISFKKGIK